MFFGNKNYTVLMNAVIPVGRRLIQCNSVVTVRYEEENCGLCKSCSNSRCVAKTASDCTSWGSWTTSVSATCSSPGIRTRKCNNPSGCSISGTEVLSRISCPSGTDCKSGVCRKRCSLATSWTVGGRTCRSSGGSAPHGKSNTITGSGTFISYNVSGSAKYSCNDGNLTLSNESCECSSSEPVWKGSCPAASTVACGQTVYETGTCTKGLSSSCRPIECSKVSCRYRGTKGRKNAVCRYEKSGGLVCRNGNVAQKQVYKQISPAVCGGKECPGTIDAVFYSVKDYCTSCEYCGKPPGTVDQDVQCNPKNASDCQRWTWKTIKVTTCAQDGEEKGTCENPSGCDISEKIVTTKFKCPTGTMCFDTAVPASAKCVGVVTCPAQLFTWSETIAGHRYYCRSSRQPQRRWPPGYSDRISGIGYGGSTGASGKLSIECTKNGWTSSSACCRTDGSC